jgi:hypothetical protein
LRHSGTQPAWGKRFAYGINVVAACWALRLLSIPAGRNLFMGFEFFLALVIAGLGVVIGIPLSWRDMGRGCTKLDSNLGMALSLTPLLLYVFLVMLIARAKHFTFF